MTDTFRAYLSQRRPTLMDGINQYGVLVPLVEWKGQWHLGYEVRAHTLRRQPGEVCFPGGKMEGGETPWSCALREAEEELGLAQDGVELLGPCDFLVHRAQFILYPMLGRVRQECWMGQMRNPQEVAETFLVPLSHFKTHPPLEYHYTLLPQTGEHFPYELLGIPRDYVWEPGGEKVFVYPWEGRAIWGMTGKITHHVIQLLEEMERAPAEMRGGEGKG